EDWPMADQQDHGAPAGATDLADSMAHIAERSQALVTAFAGRQPGAIGMGDPLNVGAAFVELTQRMMTNPAVLMQAQLELWQSYMGQGQATAQKRMGEPADPVGAPEKHDRRFRDAEWDENILFDYIKQSYLLSSRWLTNTVHEVEGLDEKTARKVDFY